MGNSSSSTAKELIIGAGGGGDTAAAILRALHAIREGANSDSICVVGAGYSDKEYIDNLVKRGVRADLVQDYLTAIFEHGTRKFRNFCDAAVISAFEAARDAVFLPLIKNGKSIAEQDAGFKYMTLLDEVAILIQFRVTFPVWMLQTVPLLDGALFATNFPKKAADMPYYVSQLPTCYEGLRTLLQTFRPDTLRLLDFGGDVFDIKAIARDSSLTVQLLHALLALSAHGMTDTKLVFEVHGLGADVHAPATVAATNALTFHATPFDASSFAAFLSQADIQPILVANGLTGKPGRAMENWLMARGPSISIVDYIEKYLMARVDYKDADGSKKATMNAYFAELSASKDPFNYFRDSCEATFGLQQVHELYHHLRSKIPAEIAALEAAVGHIAPAAMIMSGGGAAAFDWGSTFPAFGGPPSCGAAFPRFAGEGSSSKSSGPAAGLTAAVEAMDAFGFPTLGHPPEGAPVFGAFAFTAETPADLTRHNAAFGDETAPW